MKDARMDNKSELFDLEREKRELDTFLSTIAGDGASVFPSAKSSVPVKEAPSSLPKSKSAFEAFEQEPVRMKPDQPAAKMEVPKPAGRKDKAYASEFISKLMETDPDPLGRAEQSGSRSDKISSFLLMDEEKKADALPRVKVPSGVKPLESFKTMTRFDKTIKSEERIPLESKPLEMKPWEAKLPEMKPLETKPLEAKLPEVKPLETKPLPEVKKAATDVRSGKKTETADPYDYSPKKGIGKGKLIWVLIIVVVLLLVGYLGFFSKSFVPGVKNLFKTELGTATSSAKGINLLGVRQRLVYNVKLGRSIRVVEGIAENSTAQPVSKIKIAANLYAADGALLASMESFGGQILIDSQLENLDEAGLISELSKSRVSEDKIPASGQIPFMIIFTKELAGVHRLSVLAIDYVKH